ncbi:MAG: hypothetical protein Q4F31_10490 [Eubacteriales bacterium]|nr:hypothetical protein [Eubacteriales bacterium]
MRTKITKETIPNDFTLSLAIVDAIPVIFFCLSMITVGARFKSILFLTGALLALFAGVAKVLWKIIVVLKRKNIWWLFLQMRITMPIGLILMIVSVIINRQRINVSGIWNAITALPAIVFFIIGAAGIVLMMVFAFALDGSKVKSNWIEQITNGIAQAAFFVGILLL